MGQGAWRRAQAIALRLTFKSIKGLLLWQRGLPLLSPFQNAAARFDRIKSALRASDDADLLEGCVQVVGLGPGLTPSGDDFLGGLFFALGCSPDWQANSRFERLRAALILRTTAMEPMLTNPISYALMLDLMHQSSYQPVHELLEALGRADEDAVLASCEAMMQIGSSSGHDILAGILTALTYDK